MPCPIPDIYPGTRSLMHQSIDQLFIFGSFCFCSILKYCLDLKELHKREISMMNRLMDIMSKQNIALFLGKINIGNVAEWNSVPILIQVLVQQCYNHLYLFPPNDSK